MKKLSHSFYIRSTGRIWFIIGCWILYKGLLLARDFCLQKEGGIFFQAQIFAWIFFAFLAGFFKGRFILRKTAQRVSNHILSLPLPLSLHKIYTPSYFLLLGLMMGLAFVLRTVPISSFSRGLVDIAIGFALINGSFFYFRPKT